MVALTLIAAGFLSLMSVILTFVVVKNWRIIRLIGQARKNRMPLMQLHTPTVAKFCVPNKAVHNWYHISDSEVVIATPHSVKASDIGVSVATGDYYCSVLMPPEILELFEKNMEEGKTVKDFQTFLEEIADDEGRFEEISLGEDKSYKIGDKTVEFKFFKSVDPAKGKDFVNIGLNPAYLNLQRKSGELTDRLAALKPRNWENLVMPIMMLLIVLLAIWMMTKNGGGTEALSTMTAVTESIMPSTISP